MASTALAPELVCGHMLVQVDILEKAVNELDARQVKAAAEQDAKHVRAEATQSAAMQLVQSLLTQMTELRNELQEVRAHNQALAARLNAELELPRSASGASRPATLEELIQRRDALAEIKAAHVDCGMAKSAGYTCAEARVVGYTLSEAKVAWATDELRAAGYISSKGMTSRDFMDQYGAGRSNFSGLDFTGEDFSRMVLDKACHFSGCIFKGASFRSATLVGVNFSHADLSDCDLSHASLRDCTLTDATPPAKGRWGGAKLSGTVPMKQFGFSCAEVKAMGMVQGLKAAGYTCAEAKQAGYVEGLKAAGYTCAEAKQAGYTCAEAKQAGYVEGLKAAGYTCAEAKQAGFNPRECMQAGFTFQEGRAAGFRSDSHHWNNGKPPPRIEPRLTLAARALRLRPPPPGEASRGRRRAAARAARALRAASRRGELAPPTHARSRAWRPRVVVQGIVTGMGINFVDGAACPRGTAPPCREVSPLNHAPELAYLFCQTFFQVACSRALHRWGHNVDFTPKISHPSRPLPLWLGKLGAADALASAAPSVRNVRRRQSLRAPVDDHACCHGPLRSHLRPRVLQQEGHHIRRLCGLLQAHHRGAVRDPSQSRRKGASAHRAQATSLSARDRER